MTITHGSLSITEFHGGIEAVGPPDSGLSVIQWPGYEGESHLVDKPKGLDLECEVVITTDTKAGMKSRIDAINGTIGVETGTITVTGPAGGTSHPKSTFLGFFPTLPAYFDTANSKWTSFGICRWRQREIG